LRFIWRLKKDESAAVAATVALSLVGLIAVGGVAFDYARMATLDTELQNAADQAALAGVTQLDGTAGGLTNAASAARTLVRNITRQSNDGAGTAIGVPTVQFLTTANVVTTDPVLAQRVRVDVSPRRVFYALTPIVGAIRSGQMNAKALAGLQSSICNVPPLYMAFDPGAEDLTKLVPGTGVELLNEEGSSLFGYLDQGGGGADLKAALAWNDQLGMCQTITTVTPKPGVVASVEKGFNTRFQNGNGQNNCPNGGGICSPAANITEYPEDTCHATSTIISPCTEKIGNGVWDGQLSGKSRYQTYKDAIGSNYAIGTDRRRLTVALIPYGSFGKSDPTTPTQWMDLFITKPMYGNGNKLRIYVEIIGVSSPAISGRRDVPYLLE
jgi:Flp pilus assembly protein TadG